MTKEEYNRFWESEARMDKIILGGAFKTALTKGMDVAEKEVETNKLINSTFKKASIIDRFKKLFKL